MFRFRLRTLLIATAFLGLFLGLQVHVHNKAKRFVEEMSEPSIEALDQLSVGFGPGIYTMESVSLSPLTIRDVLYFRRRCNVKFLESLPARAGQRKKHHIYFHYVTCFGNEFNPDNSYSVEEVYIRD